MEKIKHEFFGELDLVNGLNDGIGFSDDVVVLWEEEVNGILSYDRKIVKIDENVVREWNEKLHF